MTKPALHATRNGSRLSHHLAELGFNSQVPSHKNFAERVGQLIGLPGSLALSALPLKPVTNSSNPSSEKTQAIQANFLQQHNELIQFIGKCFDNSETRRRFRLPEVDTDSFLDSKSTQVLYQRFYIAMQTELASKAYSLHSLVRDAATDCSPALKQLCTLDKAMQEILSGQLRKAYSQIPAVVAQRYQHWQQQFSAVNSDEQNDAISTAIEQFCQELRQLLLTELDARLQTTYGLIEALNQQALQITTGNDQP
ncbi:DUF3348 family protein [Dasania marina]|uniref:DUF3348 family protein n=1 Tax=Dasania marina TaxID=471499 RepID=UPI0030DB3C81|tara:strand:+ start:35990 stop:36748 length:759 start_codon:yes stop_codon:yes gene_type:complete